MRDTGIGMDAVTQAALFTPFLQADSSITRRYGGTGLGLAISQSIVRAMGSEMAVQSSPGAGSECSFSVDLPMLPMLPVVAAPTAEPASADLPRGAALAGLRVLVVDDNDLNRFVLKRMLGDDGARVGEAGEGRAALQWLAAAPQPPDLVLMDLRMPVMDGVTAVRAMQADPRWRGVPVIIVSGDVTMDQRDAALASGARAFLPKPMMRDQLLAQVALLGIQPTTQITPRSPQADDGAPGDAPDAPRTATALVPQIDQLDELLLSVAVNELRWGHTTIGMLMAAPPVDAARLAQTAHRIKGTARELRCEPLIATALALEQACKRDPQAQRGPWPVAGGRTAAVHRRGACAAVAAAGRPG
ncbi:MAG: response regulator [Burkholderiaceae bacterium]